MADQLTLTASTDRAIGSRSSRRLRREGKVPAVVYGAGDPPTPISVEWSDLRAALTTPAGMNALITLEFNDDTRLTIVKDMQRDPVRRDVPTSTSSSSTGPSRSMSRSRSSSRTPTATT